MGMARGESDGDRGSPAARGEPVAALATSVSVAFAEHAAELRAHLVRSVRDPAAADDLVQESFVRLLTETLAGRPPLHPRGWLFRVATNLTVSRARRHSVASRHAADLLRGDTVVPSPEDVVLEREGARSLDDRLADLPAHVRTALVLAAHGYSGAEIARRIGRSELATRSLLCRQRRRLRTTTMPAA
ncbi:MAG: RNA polymerase sigma factor [Chloroflexi bacterium]|nr:RNA polymerase sigma factor [Chloroflexota bacterium]